MLQNKIFKNSIDEYQENKKNSLNNLGISLSVRLINVSHYPRIYEKNVCYSTSHKKNI